MPIDNNGIHQYEESEPAAPFSAMLNRLASSVSTAIAQLKGLISQQNVRINAQDQYRLAQSWVLQANSVEASRGSGENTVSGWTITNNPDYRFTLDTGTGRVTIPEDGLYMIMLTARLTPSAAAVMRMRTAGDFERRGNQLSIAAANQEVLSNLTMVLPLAAGAAFWPLVYCSQPTTNVVTTLEIRRIG